MSGIHIDPNIEKVLRDGMEREGWPRPAQHHPADKGGLTRGGITAGAWGRHKKLGRPAMKEELDAITDPEALEFWFLEFVVAPGLDQVTDQRLRALLVDWYFTSWNDPMRALQRSLQKRGLYDGPIDGVLGPKTKAGLFADRDPRRTYRDVLAARFQHYIRCAFDDEVKDFLLEHPQTQLIFLRGWLNRCLQFL